MKPVLGPMRPAHIPQSFEPCSGIAAMAMALEALVPNQPAWRELEHTLWCKATGKAELPGAGPARELFPVEACLAALRSGKHVRLVTRGPEVPWLAWLVHQGADEARLRDEHGRAERAARAAGLVVEQAEPTEDHVRRAIEAGHPQLLLMDGHHRHDEREPFPHWVTLIDLIDDTLHLHDPLKQGGPEEGMVSRLPAVQGFQGTTALIEVAHGNRLRR